MNFRKPTFALVLGLAGIGASGAGAATNLALASEGASVVYTSSATKLGNTAIMTGDLLLAHKVPWYFNGDTRYTFGANDPDGVIEIKLGSLSRISEIGASISLPRHDRPVVGPVAFEVSLDGAHWTDWGGPISIDKSTQNPVAISEAPELVRYIKYSFGPTSKFVGSGGAAVKSIFADGVPALSAAPEPAAWALLVAGFGLMGRQLRRRRVSAA